ncbi:MAG TPA: GGDEF domain-containing protein [Terriglobales bacterium]|nr:GGDEF domain-containing protein [Terriglobales bacterium]
MRGNAGALSASSEDRITPPSMLARTEEIQKQIQEISGRDLQLWSIGILVILVLTSGLLALALPNLVWTQRVMRIEHSYLPQLFFGLISLILLFNIYLLSQKRNLNITRLALIRELVLNERLESLSLVDPLTQLLNRRALNELVPREVARANRVGSSLTFMAIDLNGFSGISSKFGTLESDRVLIEFAKMIGIVFRGADLAFRQGDDQFLIMLPDTTEEQADYPVNRLLREVDQWNLASKKDYEVSFSWALAPYVTGSAAEDVLRTVDRKMYSKKHKLTPVF